MIDLIFLSLSLIVILIGSYTDLQTREVPDWLNYALIFSGIGIRLFVSILESNMNYFYEGLFGFAVFFSLAALLFFTGQWGGGDSKLLMGLGAMIGMQFKTPQFNYFIIGVITFSILLLFNIYEIKKILGRFSKKFVEKKKNQIQVFSNILLVLLSIICIIISITMMDFSSKMVIFVFNLMFVGGIYGLLWSLFLVVKNIKKFTKEFKIVFNDFKRFHTIVSIVCIALIITSVIFLFLQQTLMFMMFGILSVSSYVMFIIWVGIKTAEVTCMVKMVKVEKLTEGDWIVDDVIVGKKRIAGPSDLGITKEQIEKLIKLKKQKKIDKIKIKEGIPFVPSFLFAFILTYTAPMLFFGFFSQYLI